MTGNGTSKSGKMFEAAQRVLKVSNGVVLSLCCYVVAAVVYVTAQRESAGSMTVENVTATNIRVNIALSSMIGCVQMSLFFLISYIKRGSKRLFRRKIRIGASAEESVTATSSSGG